MALRATFQEVGQQHIVGRDGLTFDRHSIDIKKYPIEGTDYHKCRYWLRRYDVPMHYWGHDDRGQYMSFVGFYRFDQILN